MRVDVGMDARVLVLMGVLVTIVMVLVMMVATVPVSVQFQQFLRPPPKQESSDPDDGHTRDDTHHLHKSLGQQILREEQRHGAEKKDAGRVGESDHPAQKRGVSECSTRANEISSDHRLTVAGLDCV